MHDKNNTTQEVNIKLNIDTGAALESINKLFDAVRRLTIAQEEYAAATVVAHVRKIQPKRTQWYDFQCTSRDGVVRGVVEGEDEGEATDRVRQRHPLAYSIEVQGIDKSLGHVIPLV
jgi:phosphodiesterase/alkaline phosphatase D-like protein